jgi:hypothetical protein
MEVKRMRLHKHTVVLLALAGTAAALIGCGESEDDRVRRIAEQIIRGDSSFCDHMTNTLLRETFQSIRGCKKATARTKRLPDARLSSVKVNGDEATAILLARERRAVVRFTLGDGDWKIAGIREKSDPEAHDHRGHASTADAPERQVTQAPKIKRGLDPREAVEAYYGAIRAADGPTVCGLLSRRHATEVRGGVATRTPFRDCVEALSKYDWTAAQRNAKRATVVAVRIADDEATVRLSHGKQAQLERQGGRWVIDDIVSH